jgi:hypothetical protein
LLGTPNMHTSAIIIVCFGTTLTAGFLLAGYVALLAPDDEDRRRLRDEMAAAKQKGNWEEYLVARRGALRISQIGSHWRNRPDARRSIWVGLTSGIITLVAAKFI